jgi:hypothetical protein
MRALAIAVAVAAAVAVAGCGGESKSTPAKKDHRGYPNKVNGY